MASVRGVKAGRAFIEIMMDDSKLVQGMKRAQAKLQGFSTSVTAMGTKLTMIGAAISAPMAFATKQFADFDDQMRLVQGVTGATDDGLQKLTDTAKELGRTTSYTAAQVAQGMVSLARMGFTVDEINNSIGNFMNLDRATGMNNLGQSAEIAAAAMRSFGLAAKDTSHISDVLAMTANGSAQRLEDVGEALKMAAPNAHMANATLEDTCAMLGLLANLGIKGSLAGTALAKSFQQLSSGKGMEVLNGKGIQTKDANGNLRNMRDILIDIAKVTKTMGTADKIAFLTDVFDVRGVKGGGLIAGNLKDLDAMMAKIEQSAGYAEATAKKMDSGIGGAFRLFLSAVNDVGLEIGQIIGEYLQPYINKITDVLNGVSKWVKAHKEMVIVIVKATAGFLAAGAALVTLGIAVKVIAVAVGGLCAIFSILKFVVLAPIAAIKALMVAFTLLKAVLIGVKVVALATWAAISSPAVLVGAALAALVAVVWKLTGAWDICAGAVKGLAADFGTAFKAIGEVVGKTWETIKLALASDDLAGAAKVGLAALKVVWLTGIFPLKKAWFELKNFLDDSWTITVYSILKLANNLWYGLLVGLKEMGDAMQDSWAFIWDGIVGAFDATIAELKKAWIEAKGVFSSRETVDAQLAEVDSEYNTKKSNRENQTAENVVRRENERKDLYSEWDKENGYIDEAMYQEINENQQAYRDALGGAAAEIEAAKGQWQSAMDEVKKRAAERAAKTAEAKAQVEDVSTAQTDSKLGISGDTAVGSWNLAALDAALGNTTAADRTAAATEKSVALQEKTNKKLDDLKDASKSTTTVYGN